MKKWILSLILAVGALMLNIVAGRADGIIIPEPPICDPAPCPPQPLPLEQLAVRYHHVSVRIEEQLAVTHVDQVFYNPNDWQIEGTYLFPLPKDAAVTSFTLWVDGQPVQGQVLDASEARQTYEDIVRSMRDPALLEYADRGAVQARIFPIPPQGERRIELEYTQALSAENGLVRYTYPLNTEKFSALPLEDVSINIDIRSSAPIRAVYSPSHNIGISRESENHVTAGYEDSQVRPDSDFTLVYSVGEGQAFHLMTFRDPGDPQDPDGFFMLLLAPQPDAAAQTVSKDVILVLDRSGSMEGEKFQQAQEALVYILEHLNPEDHFGVIAFSTGMDMYRSRLSPASEAPDAVAWVDRLGAQGSTDINRALLEASSLANTERPTYLIFLTDGLPTEGEIDSQRILANFASATPDNLRLFAFGVGYDVDTYLLDSLAQSHHGSTTYVTPGERLDEILSDFYAKISAPVLTDLSLDFGDLAAYDIYPQPLPDLFAGSQIVVVGRYHKGGSADLTLSGLVQGRSQTFSFPELLFDEETPIGDFRSAIPRLWATRKIGYLLNQIRLDGAQQELIDQIVRLSIRYGIVTPYTSYLVTEEMPLGAAEQERIAGEQYLQALSEPPAPSSGQDAVEKAVGEGAMAGAGAPAAQSAETADVVRILGSRTFVLSNGVWMDTTFDPQTMQTQKLSFLSDEYFSAVQSNPDLAAAFSLGDRVIAVFDGTPYEVIVDGQPSAHIDLPVMPTELASNTPVVKDPVSTPENIAQPGANPDSGSALPCVAGLAPAGIFVVWLMFVAIRRRPI